MKFQSFNFVIKSFAETLSKLMLTTTAELVQHQTTLRTQNLHYCGEFQVYPLADHSLSRVTAHLHASLEAFFASCVGNKTLLSPLGSPYTQSDVEERDSPDDWM